MKEIKFICLKTKYLLRTIAGYIVRAGTYTVFSSQQKNGPLNTGLFKTGCDRGTPFCQENMAMAVRTEHIKDLCPRMGTLKI